MLRRFLPKETSFFDFFEQHCKLTNQACMELLDLVSDPTTLTDKVSRIKKLEHETDEIAHRCIEALHKTFITPIDRAEIHRLIKRMDDIIDSVDAAAMRLSLYEIVEMRKESQEFAKVLIRATAEIYEAVKGLRHMNNADLIKQKCIAIYQLENDGDTILRSALARLFKEESQAIMVIKWKEIYECLEKAIDRCEDVANIIEGVVLEAS